MPGYGISPGPNGLLPWSWAQARLRDARNYWVASTGPDGAPHLAAVWAVWFDGAVVFSTGGRSRKARCFMPKPTGAWWCPSMPSCVASPKKPP